MQVQKALADRDLDVGDHVLYVACYQVKHVARDALAEEACDEEGCVNALVPGSAPRDDQLAGREEQGGAVGLVKADGDGGEFALVVERER